jgi:hypothetical protein
VKVTAKQAAVPPNMKEGSPGIPVVLSGLWLISALLKFADIVFGNTDSEHSLERLIFFNLQKDKFSIRPGQWIILIIYSYPGTPYGNMRFDIFQ